MKSIFSLLLALTTNAAVPLGPVTVASDVPNAQIALLSGDFDLLKSIRLQQDDRELRQILELDTLSGPALTQWLGDRVRFVVGPNTTLETALVPANDPNFRYENPALFPPLTPPSDAPSTLEPKSHDRAHNTGSQETSAVLVMQNLGGVAYLVGKTNQTLGALNIPGVGLTPIKSPRTGVLQIGPGLFQPMLNKYGQTDIHRKVYSLYRIAAFFHEARHSDGNGTSLMFAHTFCPSGHDYAGNLACDNNTNGPYTLGGRLLRNMSQSCRDCTTGEREALRLVALDSFSRVLKEAPRYTTTAQALAICQTLAADTSGNAIASILKAVMQEQCTQTIANPDMVPATAWDSRPEGRR